MKQFQSLLGIGLAAALSCVAAQAQVNTNDPSDTPEVRNHQMDNGGPGGMKMRHHGRQMRDRNDAASSSGASPVGSNEDLNGTAVSSNDAERVCNVLSNPNKRSDCVAKVNDESGGSAMSSSSGSMDRDDSGKRARPAPVVETPGRVLRGRKP